MTPRDTFLFLAVSLGLLFGPALTAHAAPEEAGDENRSDRAGFFVSQFRDFRAIDNRHVVLYGPSRKHAFLATTFGYCNGLTFAESIAIDSSLPFLSARNNAAIIVHDTFPSRCLIQTFERVDDFAAAKALVKKRKKLAENY